MAHMAPKVTTWIVLLIASCSICCPTCATCDAIWTMGICRDCESKNAGPVFPWAFQVHLRAMASHIKKWSRFDTMMFTYFGHYLALTHFSTNVPMPMLLRNEPNRKTRIHSQLLCWLFLSLQCVFQLWQLKSNRRQNTQTCDLAP